MGTPEVGGRGTPAHARRRVPGHPRAHPRDRAVSARR
ncbi:hypothetical protein M2271_004205 [Streptomyces sp. LBL]|nr:hypothetical protein [Streptomyces sp. LBL]